MYHIEDVWIFKCCVILCVSDVICVIHGRLLAQLHYKASLILKITVFPEGLGGLHKDIVEYKSKEPCAGCKIGGVGG